MTDITVIEAPAAKPPRRKYRRRKKPARKVAVAKVVAPDELAGMTETQCPAECRAAGCVISGRSYCAHPRKGGLQGSDLSDPAAIDRLQRARSALEHQRIDAVKD